MPARAPRLLDVLPYARVGRFTWKVVHASYQYGRQISYPIIVHNLRTGENDFIYNFPVVDQSKIDYTKWLFGLKGLTNYQLNVSLINQVGEGPIASIFFTTQEGGKKKMFCSWVFLVPQYLVYVSS